MFSLNPQHPTRHVETDSLNRLLATAMRKFRRIALSPGPTGMPGEHGQSTGSRFPNDDGDIEKLPYIVTLGESEGKILELLEL